MNALMTPNSYRSANRVRSNRLCAIFAGCVLALTWTVPLAGSPPPPAADYPAQPFASFEVTFDSLWQTVEKAVSAPYRRILLRDASFGVLTFSEYVAPQLTDKSFRNQAIFCAKLQKPPDGMAALLSAELSAATRAELAAYDARQFPSDELIRMIALDVNRLMFSNALIASPAGGSPQAIRSGDAWALARWNRRSLEAAFPDEILRSPLLDKGRSESTVLISVYLLRQEAKKTVLFVSAWIEGQPVRGAVASRFLAEVKRLMGEARSSTP